MFRCPLLRRYVLGYGCVLVDRYWAVGCGVEEVAEEGHRGVEFCLCITETDITLNRDERTQH